MKKIISILILSLLLTNIGDSALAKAKKKKKPSIKHKIELATKDKYLLVGDLYLADPKTDKPLIVLAHSFGVNAKAWESIALELRKKGYNSLAMDLRGHGRSVYTEKLKLKPRNNFTQKDWDKLPKDVIESINYIKANYPHINCNEVYFVGADIGASAQILGGLALQSKPVKFVLISPMLNFKGLYIPIKIANYKDTKFLVMLSKSDKILFNFHSKYEPKILKYEIGGAGNSLLKANPKAQQEIINFLSSN